MADNIKVGNLFGLANDYDVRSRETTTGAKHVQSVAVEAAVGSVAAVPQDIVSPQTLLAANAKRVGFVIQNDDENRDSRLFVKFGAAASLTDFTRILQPGEVWDRPICPYTGIITGIWDIAGALGRARTTEESI